MARACKSQTILVSGHKLRTCQFTFNVRDTENDARSCELNTLIIAVVSPCVWCPNSWWQNDFTIACRSACDYWRLIRPTIFRIQKKIMKVEFWTSNNAPILRYLRMKIPSIDPDSKLLSPIWAAELISSFHMLMVVKLVRKHETRLERGLRSSRKLRFKVAKAPVWCIAQYFSVFSATKDPFRAPFRFSAPTWCP